MICLQEEYIEDIYPRYQGDTIRDHIIRGTFPRRVTELSWYEDTDPIYCTCKRCQAEFSIPAKTYARLDYQRGAILCWQCYSARKRQQQARSERHVMRYISGQVNYL